MASYIYEMCCEPVAVQNRKSDWDMRDYSIVQIRGKYNKPTEYDQEIAVLITQNMPKIRRAHRKQQKLTAALAA